MKRLTFLAVVLAAFCCFSCGDKGKSSHDANTFESKLKQLFLSNEMMTNIDGTNLESYTDLLKLKGIDENEAKSLCEEYFKDQFLEDMVATYIPYYKNYLSETQIDSLIQQFESPQGKISLKNIAQATKAVKAPELQEELQAGIKSAMEGQEVKDFEPEECTATYLKKFDTYYTVTNQEEAALAILSTIEDMLSAMSQALQDQESKEKLSTMLEVLKEYLTNNMKTLTLNAFHPEVTEADLDFYVGVMNTQAGKEMNKANTNAAKNFMTIGLQMVDKFNTWVEKKQQTK